MFTRVKPGHHKIGKILKWDLREEAHLALRKAKEDKAKLQ